MLNPWARHPDSSHASRLIRITSPLDHCHAVAETQSPQASTAPGALAGFVQFILIENESALPACSRHDHRTVRHVPQLQIDSVIRILYTFTNCLYDGSSLAWIKLSRPFSVTYRIRLACITWVSFSSCDIDICHIELWHRARI